MRVIKFLSLAFLVVFFIGCSTVVKSNDCLSQEASARALPGTKTAVVGIFLKSDGTPQETYKEVILHPGQRVVYAGPDRFSIIFKNKKTPNSKVDNESKNGVVIIDIPKDIFEKREFIEEFKKNKFLVFDYGISVNGKYYDPPIKVVPDDGTNL